VTILNLEFSQKPMGNQCCNVEKEQPISEEGSEACERSPSEAGIDTIRIDVDTATGETPMGSKGSVKASPMLAVGGDGDWGMGLGRKIQWRKGKLLGQGAYGKVPPFWHCSSSLFYFISHHALLYLPP